MSRQQGQELDRVAIAYVRCSSARQAEKESSLPAQRAEIERRAKQEGYTIIRWYKDAGISGKSIEGRPGVQALLEPLERKRDKNPEGIQRLYIYDSSRLARNRAEMFYVRGVLHKANVQLIAITQPSVEDAAANAILESVWDGIAEAKRLQLAKDVRRGQRQALVDGWWPHNKAPFGYRIIGEANQHGIKRFKLLPDPDQATVVRHVFDLYLGGLGFKRIAARLDEEGTPAPSRRDKAKGLVKGWRAKHVSTIVKDQRYTGVALWDDEVVCKDHHLALIDGETFQQAQDKRAARRRSPSVRSRNTARSERGLFRPWLRCGHCGSTVTLNRGGKNGNYYWYYVCSTRAANKASCPGINVRTDALDEALLATIEQDVLTPERVRALIEDTLERMREDAGGEVEEARKMLEARIADTSAKLSRLVELVANGAMELEDVGIHSKPLREIREMARERMAALPDPKPVPHIDDVDPELFRQRVLEAWRHKDIVVRRKALERLIVKVVLKPGVARIQYAWKAESDEFNYQDPHGPP